MKNNNDFLSFHLLLRFGIVLLVGIAFGYYLGALQGKMILNDARNLSDPTRSALNANLAR